MTHLLLGILIGWVANIFTNVIADIIANKITSRKNKWASGEMEVRDRLKICWSQDREGSTPSSPTNFKR